MGGPSPDGFRARSILPIVAILLILVVAVPLRPSIAAPMSPRGVVPSPSETDLAAAAASLDAGVGPADGHFLSCRIGDGAAACAPATIHGANGSGGSGGFGQGSGSWNGTGNRSGGIGPGWTNITNYTYGPSPAHLGDAGFTYDAADHYVLLADGLLDSSPTENAPSESTWNFTDGNWTELSTSSSYNQPSTRWGLELGMTYDAADGYVVLFGGLDPSGNVLNDTWTFSAGSWTKLSVTSSPPARTWPSLTYDAADGYVLLFGGATSQASGTLNDAWSFLAGKWTQIPNNGTQPWPSARRGANLVYDPSDHYVVLFAGEDNNGTLLNDTWTYLGGNWTELQPRVSPPPRFVAGMTYYAPYQYLLMFGGCIVATGCGSQDDDLWAFHAGQWMEIDQDFTFMPEALGGPLTTWDPQDGYVLVYGGSLTGYHSNSTWAFNWPLSASLHPSISTVEVGVPVDFTASALGGSLFHYNYSFAASNATCTPVNRSIVACTFPTPGTASVSVSVNDTVGDVANATANLTVVPAVGVALAASPTLPEVNLSLTLYANVTGGHGPFDYTYTGLPTGCVTRNAATDFCVLSVPGNFTPSVTISDSLGGRAVASTTLSVAGPLTASVPSTDGDAGVPLAPLQVQDAGGQAPYTITWLDPPRGCTANATGALACTISTPGTYVAQVVVSDRAGARVALDAVLEIAPLPTIEVAVDPSAAVAPARIGFSSDAFGGTGSLNVSWDFADGTTALGVQVDHTFTSPGNYTVAAWVNDSVGGTARANVTVDVVAPLAVTLLSSAQGNVTDVGLSVTFSTLRAGGDAPFFYTWKGLPTGCVAGSVLEVTCKIESAGASSPTVTVKDSLGEVETGSAVLQANAAIAAGPYGVASPAACGVVPTEQFGANASGGTGTLTDLWQFGDGATATGATTTHTYAAAGTYTASVQIADMLDANRTFSLTVTIVTSPCPAPVTPVSELLSPLVLGALIVFALAVVLAVTLLVVRRRRPPMTPYEETARGSGPEFEAPP